MLAPPCQMEFNTIVWLKNENMTDNLIVMLLPWVESFFVFLNSWTSLAGTRGFHVGSRGRVIYFWGSSFVVGPCLRVGPDETTIWQETCNLLNSQWSHVQWLTVKLVHTVCRAMVSYDSLDTVRLWTRTPWNVVKGLDAYAIPACFVKSFVSNSMWTKTAGCSSLNILWNSVWTLTMTKTH